jgi:hypothetical protein
MFRLALALPRSSSAWQRSGSVMTLQVSLVETVDTITLYAVALCAVVTTITLLLICFVAMFGD